MVNWPYFLTVDRNNFDKIVLKYWKLC